MIKSLRIKNYKSFKDSDKIVIKPITLFVGPNSSGKSSFFQPMLLMKQTIQSTDLNTPLLANGKWINVGTFPEFIYMGDIKNEISFEFQIGPENIIQTKKSKTDSQNEIDSDFYFNVSYEYIKSQTRIRVKKSSFKILDYLFELESKQKNGKYYNLKYNDFVRVKNGINEPYTSDKVEIIKFYDVNSDKNQSNDKFISSRNFLSQLLLESTFQKLFYIGPLRDYPQRIYFTSGEAPVDVGERGQRAIDALWYSHIKEKDSKESIESKLIEWFSKFGFSKEIHLEKLSKNGIHYELMVKDAKTGHNTNIVDVGFGVSQTLPIIVECFYAPIDSTVLIEQPEIHLHPKAQAVLADLFIDAIKQKDKNFIIETHSEHLLSRIRRRVVECPDLSPEDIAIYYFDKTESGTVVEEVIIDEFGQYIDYPEGFFNEGFVDSIEHLKSIAKAKENIGSVCND